MPTTSPYSPNDYQAVSTFRPYELPVNDILKANIALNQFWDEGARAVKSRYQSALNLNLTSAENRQVRDEFLKQAQDKINSLSKMDLSDPSVQRQGIGVFKPLFEDEAIMMDDYLTERYKQVVDEAQRYKNDEKTKGEGFHTDNLGYALRPFKGFGRDTKRGEIKSIFDRAKNAEYIPYTDVSKEYMEIWSKCKGDTFKTNTPQGLYFRELEDNGKSAEQINGCISSGISDKAWQQLRITGTMRIGDDISTLGKGYVDILNGSNKSYADEVVRLAAERNKEKDPEKRKILDQAISSSQARINENKAVISRINANDFSDVEKNYDNVVAQVWAKYDIGGFANAWAYEDRTDKWSANAAGIAVFNEENQNRRWLIDKQIDAANRAEDREWKEREFNLKMYDILMRGASSGGTGGGMGATYEMFSELGRKLGLPDTFVPLDSNAVELPTQEKTTLSSLDRSIQTWHDTRMQDGLMLYNTLKEIVGPNGSAALDAAVRLPNGAVSTESAFEYADKYLQRSAGGTPMNAVQERKLTELYNKYQSSKSMVWEYMGAKDKIMKEVDMNKVNEENSRLSKFIDDQWENNSIKGNSVEFSDGEALERFQLSKEDLKLIALGKHSRFKLSENISLLGGIINTQPNIYDTKTNKQYTTNYTVMLHNITKASSSRNSTVEDLSRKAIDKYINGPDGQRLVQNRRVVQISNEPGVAESIRRSISFIPEFQNTKAYSIRPTLAFVTENGEVMAELKIHNATAKSDGTYVDGGEVDKNTILKKIQESGVNITNPLSPVQEINGKLYVKANYLPFGGARYDMDRSVQNYVEGFKYMKTQPGEATTQQVKRLAGGFKSGIKLVNQGVDVSSKAKNPPIIIPYYEQPDGTIVELGETLLPSQASEMLAAFERTELGKQTAAYYAAKKKEEEAKKQTK